MINGFGSSPPTAMQYAIAQKRTQIGADWSFWIAGLSLVSSIAILAGYNYHPVVGLGTTELISEMGTKSATPLQSGSKLAAFAFDLLASGFYVLYGVFGRKGTKWAFLTGMVFYTLDAVLLLVSSAYLGVAFHAYALFRIFQGFQAAQQFAILRMQQEQFSMPPIAGAVPPSHDIWPPPPSV